MLNKIKVIGEVLLPKIKEQDEQMSDHPNFVSEEVGEVGNDFDKSQPKFDSEKENRKPRFYFSLLVTNPNLSSTTLRCFIQGESAEIFKKEIKEGELVKVRGYLRNDENEWDGQRSKQILIKVLKFQKLDPDFKVDHKRANKVRLEGKIITDLQDQRINHNPEVLSFKVVVHREGNKSQIFFCRVHGQELITEVKKKLQKGDIVVLKGFLQTKKLESAPREGSNEETKKFPLYISSIICYGFALIDSDFVDTFRPMDNLTWVVKEVKEIDYGKPKPQTDEPEIN